MKIKDLIFFVILGIFSSCEKEVEITPRDYPFVESVGISDVDDEGATVNFEVRKNGTGTISEYGIEFIEATKVKYIENVKYLKISQSGLPSSPQISIRISYDLVKDEEYLVRPYAKTGDWIVYGENLLFYSKGVNPPEVKEVSPTEFYRSARIKITGNYFNSRQEYNNVKILGLEEQYRVTLESVTNQEIVVKVEQRNYNFQPTEEKFDLLVMSGNKSVIVPKVFSVKVPQITQVSPLSLYVGERIGIQLTSYDPDEQMGFYLNYGRSPNAPIYPIIQMGNGWVEGIVRNLPPGKYPLSMNYSLFGYAFRDQVEILPSWETFQSELQISKISNYSHFILGDRLIFSPNLSDSEMDLYLFELGDNQLRLLSPNSEIPKVGIGGISLSHNDQYIYKGLGLRYTNTEVINLKDFHRFNLFSNRWEKLADFPFQFTNVLRCFGLNGKIYAVMQNYTNFRIYDPQINQWSLSQIEVPAAIRAANSFVEVSNYLYFISSKSPLEISRYQIGGQIELFAETSNVYYYDDLSLAYWDGNLIFSVGGSPVLRIDMMTREVKDIQQISESPFSYFIPWPTSQGLMLAFPIHKNTKVQENKIYRLIQDF